MTTPQRLRADLSALLTFAEADLSAILALAEADAVEALRDLLPALVETYGSAASTVAADWYDELRLTSEVRGRFSSVPAVPSDRGAQSLIGWAADSAVDDATFKVLLLGGVQRRIFDHARSTVMGSTLADPAAAGWQRVGIGECKFCEMLIGRGAVYSEATVDFAAHDNCKCGAVPAWGGRPVSVRPYKVSPRRIIDPATGKPVPDADFERAKKWIATNL